MQIKAIETSYNGYKFRSRLEARWALYFDNLNIEYLYEPEGFILSDGSAYLPDFYLPKFKCFAEVKGIVLDTFDYNRAKQLVKDLYTPLIILDGAPSFRFYQMLAPAPDSTEIEIININMVQSPKKANKFLRNRCLSDKQMFEDAKYDNAIQAVNKTRKERFST